MLHTLQLYFLCNLLPFIQSDFCQVIARQGTCFTIFPHYIYLSLAASDLLCPLKQKNKYEYHIKVAFCATYYVIIIKFIKNIVSSITFNSHSSIHLSIGVTQKRVKVPESTFIYTNS